MYCSAFFCHNVSWNDIQSIFNMCKYFFRPINTYSIESKLLNSRSNVWGYAFHVRFLTGFARVWKKKLIENSYFAWKQSGLPQIKELKSLISNQFITRANCNLRASMSIKVNHFSLKLVDWLLSSWIFARGMRHSPSVITPMMILSFTLLPFAGWVTDHCAPLKASTKPFRHQSHLIAISIV